MSSSNRTSVWYKFFTDAGIPSGDSTTYALIFSENRIKQDILPELNKEYLKDMGITLMGDVIAILKHVRNTTSSSLKPQSGNATLSERRDIARSMGTKGKSAASRILEHYVRKGSPPKKYLSSDLSSRLKKSSNSTRSSVFNRLGENSVSSTTGEPTKITVTMLGREHIRPLDISDSYFGRMHSDDIGGFSNTTSPLEYKGVFKHQSKDLVHTKKKLPHPKAESTRAPKVVTMSADTTTGIRGRLGQKSRIVTVSEGIFAKEFAQMVKQRHLKRDRETSPEYEEVIAKPAKKVPKLASPRPQSPPTFKLKQTDPNKFISEIPQSSLKSLVITKKVHKKESKSPKKKSRHVSPPPVYISVSSSDSDSEMIVTNDSFSEESDYARPSPSSSLDSSSSGSPPSTKKVVSKKRVKSKSKKHTKKKKKHSRRRESPVVVKRRDSPPTSSVSDTDSSRSSNSSDESSERSQEVIQKPLVLSGSAADIVMPPRKKFIKKITKIDRMTGKIISEEKQEINTGVFSRLGD